MVFASRLAQSVRNLFREKDSTFPHVARFARGNSHFRKAARMLFPACAPETLGEMLLQKAGRIAVERDYSQLISFLDVLRPFLNPDQSADAEGFWNAFVRDCRTITEKRLLNGKFNSLWGVTPIVNLRAGVAADRALNMNASSIVFTTYHTASDFDFVLSDIQSRLAVERSEDVYLFRWVILIWVIANFDVFHLYNDRGIIEPAGGYGSPRFGIAMREMELYRQAGKRLYTYAYGADHRTREKTLALGKWSFCSECPDPATYCVCDDVGGAKMLEVIRGYSTAVIAHGLAMKLIPNARNVPYLAVDVATLNPRERVDRPSGKLLVGHFPNHPYFKGTKYLEKAVLELQSEGYRIELLQLSGKANAEILAAMQEIDVLVDQLVGGSFGLTAIEAMASGCPVICYLHAGVDVAELDACPIIRADPDSIKCVLKCLMSDRVRLSAAEAAGPAYVRRNYSIEALARHLADLYIETAGLPEREAAKMDQRARALASLV